MLVAHAVRILALVEPSMTAKSMQYVFPMKAVHYVNFSIVKTASVAPVVLYLPSLFQWTYIDQITDLTTDCGRVQSSAC